MVQARLLDIAIREFGAKGLEGASTRGIAAAADTAMSSITYHYGGKEGLYLAAADHVAGRMREETVGIEQARVAIDSCDAAAARAAIHLILGPFVAKMAGIESEAWAPFIIREQLDPTEAFDRIYKGAMGPMLETVATLVCVATGRHDLDEARVVTITLAGHAMVLRGGRAMCLRLLGAQAIGDDELARIERRVAANIDAILDRLIAEQQEK